MSHLPACDGNQKNDNEIPVMCRLGSSSTFQLAPCYSNKTNIKKANKTKPGSYITRLLKPFGDPATKTDFKTQIVKCYSTVSASFF